MKPWATRTRILTYKMTSACWLAAGQDLLKALSIKSLYKGFVRAASAPICTLILPLNFKILRLQVYQNWVNQLVLHNIKATRDLLKWFHYTERKQFFGRNKTSSQMLLNWISAGSLYFCLVLCIAIGPIIRAHCRYSFLHRFVQPRQGQSVGRS